MWLKENYDIDDLIKKQRPYDKIYYQSYDIEIQKDAMSSNLYSFYLNAPAFTNLYEIYLWLDGVIKQLEKIKTEKEFL
jgi:hypothetical protein